MAQTKFSDESLKSELVTVDGQKIIFNDIIKKHPGKTVVIEFWASWCSDCVKAMPKVKALQTKNPQVKFIFVSLDKTQEKWLTGIQKHELAGDHYLVTDTDGMKGPFGKSIDLSWIPRYIIINKKAEVALFKAIETDFTKIQEVLSTLE